MYTALIDRVLILLPSFLKPHRVLLLVISLLWGWQNTWANKTPTHTHLFQWENVWLSIYKDYLGSEDLNTPVSSTCVRYHSYIKSEYYSFTCPWAKIYGHILLFPLLQKHLENNTSGSLNTSPMGIWNTSVLLMITFPTTLDAPHWKEQLFYASSWNT